MIVAIRRVTFRLYPTVQVEQKLYYHRRLHKELYNAAVYNRKTQYQKFGTTLTILSNRTVCLISRRYGLNTR
jgi:putative transposase